MMHTIEIEPVQSALPVEGVPYTWGSGQHWYVRLASGVYHFHGRGLRPCNPVSHTVDMSDFRYAKSIGFSDYKEDI